ncbi:MAG TPA: HemK/PrmC family methyltransferase [Actinomycetota bacterium]|nr:HemK/PrmC family methyltransferase [Actinomycetota bacterium]
MSEPRTVAGLLDLGERVLADSTHIFEDHDNRREAEELMGFLLDVDIDEQELPLDEELSTAARRHYLSLVTRRAGGEPFPVITGRIEFYGLDLVVRPGAFVPRPSSELTVARAARRLRGRQDPVVVDVCTGAGPIALAIADEFPKAEVWGADIDEKGLAQGRMNAKRLDIRNVRFRKSDMFSALPARLRGGVDVITGHIPYVPPDEVDDLPTEVREHEPLYTLTDESADGLSLIRGAIRDAPQWLKPGGWLLIEVSDDLPGKLRRLVRSSGLEDKGVATDEDELSVVVEARKPTRDRARR